MIKTVIQNSRKNNMVFFCFYLSVNKYKNDFLEILVVID